MYKIQKLFIIFLILVNSSNLFAQEDLFDPDEDNYSFEESSSYINHSHSKNTSEEMYSEESDISISIGSFKQERDETPSAGGYLGLSLSSAEARKQDPRQENGVPPPPNSDPDAVPVDGAIIYLIGAGLCYGIYKIRREHPSDAKNTIRINTQYILNKTYIMMCKTSKNNENIIAEFIKQIKEAWMRFSF